MTLLQKIEVAAALALLSCCGATACSAFKGAQSPRKDLVECYAKALEPVAGEVYDTVELAKDLVAGKASLQSVLQNLGADEKEVKAFVDALNACRGEPATVPDAGASS